jgi:hypothetical protein
MKFNLQMEEFDFLMEVLNKKNEEEGIQQQNKNFAFQMDMIPRNYKHLSSHKTKACPQLNKTNPIGNYESETIRKTNQENIFNLPIIGRNKTHNNSVSTTSCNNFRSDMKKTSTKYFITVYNITRNNIVNIKVKQVVTNKKENYPLMRYFEFRPLVEFCETAKPIDYGYYYKLVGSGECPLLKGFFEDNGFVEHTTDKEKPWTILWSSGAIKPKIYSALKKYQKINHFPRSIEITRKDLLYKNIAKLQSIYPKSFQFIPKSYILPQDIKFLEEDMEREPESMWIVKPVASSQGKGIYVTNQIQEVII